MSLAFGIYLHGEHPNVCVDSDQWMFISDVAGIEDFLTTCLEKWLKLNNNKPIGEFRRNIEDVLYSWIRLGIIDFTNNKALFRNQSFLQTCCVQSKKDLENI